MDRVDIISKIPQSGLGTVLAPEGSVDDIFPAACMIVLGFFGFIPWVVGSTYIFSENIVAKCLGITNLTFLVLVALAFVVMLATSDLNQALSFYRV